MASNTHRSSVKYILMLWLKKWVVCFIFVLAFLPATAQAHSFDYGSIETGLEVQGSELRLRTKVSQQINADAADPESQRKLFEQYFSENLKITNDNTACAFHLNTFDVSAATHTTYDGTFTCPATIETSKIGIHSTLFNDFFNNYDHFITITSGQSKQNIILKPDQQDYPSKESKSAQDNQPQPAPQPSRFTLSKQFVRMGMEHIWHGYDHILFLVSVILLLTSIRNILLVVTSFTIAHSITLILAGLGIVTISPRIVEPLIAASIVFVALRNIVHLKEKKPENHARESWLLTSGFGLVHGLGFAGALIEVGIPQYYFVPSLVLFNVGVELGQLTILLFLVPLLLWSKKFAWHTQALRIISGLTAVVASIWFLQRVL